MRIAILSNVNLDMLIQQTAKKHEVFKSDGYGQWIKFALSADSDLMEFSPDCIFIMLDGYAIIENLQDDAIKEELQKYAGCLQQFVKHYPNAMIAVSNIHIKDERISGGDFSEPLNAIEMLWNEQCRALMKTTKSVHLFPLREQIVAAGTTTVYDEKMWYLGSIPYSIGFIGKLSIAIDEFTTKLTLKRKKVLVTDLDNTLWGGIIGEDGVQGIKLSESLIGAAYRDTQKLLKQMKDRGVVLAIVSKNNEEDVNEAFGHNTHMILKPEDFSAIRINWISKAQNIQSIAQELNLGLDSFVFLDDNNVEREAVRQELPEVTVVDFPKDISKLPEVVRKAYEEYFFEWRVTDEDKVRTKQYREEAERKIALQAAETDSISMEDYLRSLDIRITIRTVNEQNIERVVQLINKTNQFNTNTIRMDMIEIRRYIERPEHRVFVSNVKDKYGDSGLIAVILASVDTSNNRAIIVNFLMSCRVMGRQIENAIIRAIEKRLLTEGIREISASYVPTAKNSPVRNLWKTLDYTEVRRDDKVVEYVKDLTQPLTPTVLAAEWT